MRWPSQLYAIADGSYMYDIHRVYRADVFASDEQWWKISLFSGHKGKAQYVFFDGHVEGLRGSEIVTPNNRIGWNLQTEEGPPNMVYNADSASRAWLLWLSTGKTP
jgi:prepilin-type processing-associated H-X9-DG protein